MRSRVYRVEAGLVVGLVMLALGLLWTLDNLQLIDAGPILKWWPLLLVLWGVMRILGFGGRRRPVAGGILVLIGVLLLSDVGIWTFGPALVLLAIGGTIIWHSLRAHPGPSARVVGASSSSDAHLRSVAVMAGVEQKVQSDAFRGGETVAMMGALEVDLRGARIAAGEAVVDVVVVMGGVELFVPPDWRVVCEAIPVMGAVEDSRKAPPTQAAQTLRVRGFVLMGGLEIADGASED